jgi:hypothetical protein
MNTRKLQTIEMAIDTFRDLANDYMVGKLTEALWVERDKRVAEVRAAMAAFAEERTRFLALPTLAGRDGNVAELHVASLQRQIEILAAAGDTWLLSPILDQLEMAAQGLQRPQGAYPDFTAPRYTLSELRREEEDLANQLRSHLRRLPLPGTSQ